jgi:hypothetical protein
MADAFDLDDLAFDGFYPMNWLIENGEMPQYQVQGNSG